MTKNQKVILFGSIAVFLCLAGLIVSLLITQNKETERAEEAQARLDSLSMANDRLQLTNEFNQLSSDFQQYEDQQVYLKNDSLISQYNEARARIEQLLKELNGEKRRNDTNVKRIKQLEGEIATLKGIVKHYLEEIKRLGEENEGLKREIEQVQQKNQALETQNETTRRDNAELAQTVRLAKKLNITNLSLQSYNKKDKVEKNITKARKLGVNFTVSPNNTAAAGMKDFYIRIVSPEGELLGGNGGSFSYDGASLAATAHRKVEYDNKEAHVSIYWNVNSTLVPGGYRVEVFCDGYRLDSREFQMKK
ncbi:MAG: hypothetical protein K2N03_07625 [Muribaculaceae bacterium]|nr:hypothetical protein [Muribaculaceae bacterium]